MRNGWLKLHRNILNWEWYKDYKTKTLFLHLLIIANYEPNRYMGVEIGIGQLVTGRKKLAEETGLSEQNIRTSLAKLEKTRRNNH